MQRSLVIVVGILYECAVHNILFGARGMDAVT